MRLLIIEDQPEVAQFLKAGLEARYFSVDIASDGEQGSFLARTNTYQAIIMNDILPKQAGPEVVREIRQDNNPVPIIIITGKNDLATKKNLYELGIDDFLSKPFVFDELLLHLKALLRRPLNIQGRFFKLGDLSIDSDEYIVKRGSKKIELTKKEFAILEFLIKNRGKVLSRTQILENVWDINGDLLSNTIETHMSSLRRKMRIPDKPDLIHTFIGRGYKLDTSR
jgi:two-component system, OmpR family, copper resistance phosphate regulon response regulator CusR